MANRDPVPQSGVVTGGYAHAVSRACSMHHATHSSCIALHVQDIRIEVPAGTIVREVVEMSSLDDPDMFDSGAMMGESVSADSKPEQPRLSAAYLRSGIITPDGTLQDIWLRFSERSDRNSRAGAFGILEQFIEDL